MPPGPQPQTTGISPEQARLALEVLNDPKKRAAFAATLDVIARAQPQPPGVTQPPQPSAEPPKPETRNDAIALPLTADSLGAQVLVTASDFVSHLGTQASEAFDAVQSLPLLWGWAVVMVTNPQARALLVDVTWRVFIALLCAIAVEYALRIAMRGPIARLEGRAPPAAAEAESAFAAPDEPSQDNEASAPVNEDAHARAEAGEIEPPIVARRRLSPLVLLRRVPLVGARLMLQLVPVFGVAATGHLMTATSVGGQTTSRLVILAVVDSYAICTAVLCISRMMLSPKVSRLRLLNLPDPAASYVTRWIRRLTIIAVFGYAFGEVGQLLGMSTLTYDALHKTIGLILHICLGVIVVQKRRAVRRWLRAPADATGPLAILRNRLAMGWHWIAIFVLAAGWITWALESSGGYGHVLRYIALTALILIGTRLLLLVLLGALERTVRFSPEMSASFPGLEARLRVYQPALALLLRSIVYVLTALGLLQLYGVPALGWFVTSALGLRTLSALGTLAVTLLLAFAVWEGVNAAIQRHLAKLQREAQMARSARLRTLLPLLRTTLLVTIAVVTGLMVLSEIGVNIAPLLAGAGIVGVAIGFGSQKLVQDLINGIFLLLENAMQVGDWVTVSGLSGTVEALSVRTIRLRASDGSVHIIPFSAVTSITNVNRGLGNASVNVTVEFDEDTDRVAEELKEIVRTMREEPNFSAKMLSELQLWGVDKVDGAAVTILGQVVCTDSGRWSVQREFNRRMKKRFQELGIRIYNPTRTIAIPGPLPAPSVNTKGVHYADAGATC